MVVMVGELFAYFFGIYDNPLSFSMEFSVDIENTLSE